MAVRVGIRKGKFTPSTNAVASRCQNSSTPATSNTRTTSSFTNTMALTDDGEPAPFHPVNDGAGKQQANGHGRGNHQIDHAPGQKVLSCQFPRQQGAHHQLTLHGEKERAQTETSQRKEMDSSAAKERGICGQASLRVHHWFYRI